MTPDRDMVVGNLCFIVAAAVALVTFHCFPQVFDRTMIGIISANSVRPLWALWRWLRCSA